MGLKNINAVISPHTPALPTPSPRLRAEPFRLSAEAAPAVQGKKWDIDRSHADFVELQKINDRLNSTARIQRTFEKRFEKLNDYIERMKAQLEGILKQFPPFPPESEARIQALRSYAFFRKMVAQLTLPPPDKSPDQEIRDLAPSSGSAWEEIRLFQFQADVAIQTGEIQTSS
ncbi:MAG: hypothetical protein H6Q42_4622 [Deltaproteobacteria bacterium]|jgi:hypothetical protein|nr:hypothetical protein [Deltaproteobacteria bacterium]